MSSSYFDKEKLIHAISFTNKCQLMFSSMTRYPETEFKGVEMTATPVYDGLNMSTNALLRKQNSQMVNIKATPKYKEL